MTREEQIDQLRAHAALNYRRGGWIMLQEWCEADYECYLDACKGDIGFAKQALENDWVRNKAFYEELSGVSSTAH